MRRVLCAPQPWKASRRNRVTAGPPLSCVLRSRSATWKLASRPSWPQIPLTEPSAVQKPAGFCVRFHRRGLALGIDCGDEWRRVWVRAGNDPAVKAAAWERFCNPSVRAGRWCPTPVGLVPTLTSRACPCAVDRSPRRLATWSVRRWTGSSAVLSPSCCNPTRTSSSMSRFACSPRPSPTTRVTSSMPCARPWVTTTPSFASWRSC